MPAGEFIGKCKAMTLLQKLGLVFESLSGSRFKIYLVFCAYVYIVIFPPNLVSYKLLAALAEHFHPKQTNKLFLKLTKHNGWSEFQRFESLVKVCLSIDLSGHTLDKFSHSLRIGSPNEALGGFLLSFQKKSTGVLSSSLTTTEYLEEMEARVTPAVLAQFLVAIGLQGHWKIADSKLHSLIVNLPDESLKRVSRIVKNYPSAAPILAFGLRGEYDLVDKSLEEKTFMITKEEVENQSPSTAVSAFYRWRNYSAAATVGLHQLEHLGEMEKIKTWKSSLISLHEASYSLTAKIHKLASGSSSKDALETLVRLDSQNIFKTSLIQNSSFRSLLERSEKSIENLSFSSIDLAISSYLDTQRFAILIEKLIAYDPAGFSSQQAAEIIKFAKTMELEHNLISSFTRKALSVGGLNTNLVMRSIENLEFGEVLSILEEKHVLFEQFFSIASFAGIQSMTNSDPVFEKYKSMFFEFWTSEEDFGRSRFELTNISKREALLSRLLNSHPLEMSKMITRTNFTNLHLNHILASAINNLAEGDYQSAHNLSKLVAKENPSWNLSRSIVNMSALRFEDKLKSNFQFQKSLSPDSKYLDNPAMASAIAGGFFDRSMTVLEKTFSKQEGIKLLGLSLPKLDWKNESILVFEHWGVSDEIRSAQEFKKLNESCENLTVICDPRLETWFKESFQNIAFIPFARQHKDWRSPRPGKKASPNYLSRYLPEQVLSDIESFDAVMPSSAITNERLVNRRNPADGEYLAKNESRFKIYSAEGKIKIGVVWRSGMLTGLRKFLYMAAEEIINPLLEISDIVEIHSIQHNCTLEEREYLRKSGVVQNDEVDFFSDLKAVGDYCSNLDLVVGLSTSGTEIAASVGTPVWMLGISPENYYPRTVGGQTKRDVLTANSEVISPRGNFERDRESVVADVMKEVVAKLRSTAIDGQNEFLSEFDGTEFPPPRITL